MTDCSSISDMLEDYINRKLTQEQNSMIVNHLAICQSCRREVAVLIKIRSRLQNSMKDIPKGIMDSAFEKIYPESDTLEDILNSNPYYMAFDMIRYSFATVKQTIQLAQQAI